MEIRTLTIVLANMSHLPRELGQWEERIRRRLSTELARGRIRLGKRARESWPKGASGQRTAQAYLTARWLGQEFPWT